MTDDMAAKMASDPLINSTVAREGKLTVVVQPVENNMRAEILPKGPADAFTARVRAMLSAHAPDKSEWIMNREAFYKLRGRAGCSTGSESGCDQSAVCTDCKVFQPRG